MNTNTMDFPWPTAPGNGLSIPLIPILNIQQCVNIRRVIVNIKTSAASAANGLTFDCVLRGDTTPTTLSTLVMFTVPATTGAVPFSNFDVAVPPGLLGFQINYANSANVLTTWAGTITILTDDRAAP